jgi:glycine cleavage system H protein
MSENVPSELLYTEDHEWIKVDGDIATIGITQHAQSELGDIVYVELPEVGDEFDKGDSMGTIEAVKTVADIYAPLAGEVTEINEQLADDSECMNTSPYSDGWIAMMKISDVDSLNKLLSAEKYLELIG